MFKAIAISLLVGAFTTSYVEYRLNYNLYDTAKDKVVAVLQFLHIVKKPSAPAPSVKK